MKSKWLHRIGSLKLGVILILTVALAVIAGTIVVQKPLAEPGQIENLYSPTKLKIYEALGLFDLFHTWWFTGLLTLLMVNISSASLIRLPVVWREVRRHREPDEKLMRAMPQSGEVAASLDAIAASLRARHYRVKVRQLADGRRGLTGSKHRYARLAPYFVHLSLLVILLGGIIDSRLGYRAFMRLNAGEQKAVAQKLVGDTTVQLPYTIRCEAAGMEQYPDGSPKRYWSRLVVVEDGREVARKEIEVNSPLVYRGIRFFQSSYGRSGEIQRVVLAVGPRKVEAETRSGAPASPHGNVAGDVAAEDAAARVVEVSAGSESEVPELGIRMRLSAFYPDFYMDGNLPATRSEEPNNPALRLLVTRGEETVPVWVFANYPQFNNAQRLPLRFNLRDLQLGAYTGLQVTNQPGQWLVWLGCTVLAFGFFWAFFFVHRQYWALEIGGGASGAAVLVSGMTSKAHEEFREEFGEFIKSLKEN